MPQYVNQHRLQSGVTESELDRLEAQSVKRRAAKMSPGEKEQFRHERDRTRKFAQLTADIGAGGNERRLLLRTVAKDHLLAHAGEGRLLVAANRDGVLTEQAEKACTVLEKNYGLKVVTTARNDFLLRADDIMGRKKVEG